MLGLRVRDHPPPGFSRQTIGGPFDDGVLVQLRKGGTRSLPLQVDGHKREHEGAEGGCGPDRLGRHCGARPTSRPKSAHGSMGSYCRRSRLQAPPRAALTVAVGYPREPAKTTSSSLPPSHLLFHLRSRFSTHSTKKKVEIATAEKREIIITAKRGKHPKREWGGKKGQGREDATLTLHSRRHSPRPEMHAQPQSTPQDEQQQQRCVGKTGKKGSGKGKGEGGGNG